MFHRIGPTSPREFFADYIGEAELDKRIVIGCDPRPEHPVGRVLTVPFYRSVSEGRAVGLLNVPMDAMASAGIAQLKAGRAVYFSCDVDRDTDREAGIMDPDLYRWDETLTPLGEFPDADRARYAALEPSHAMTFTGVNLADDGTPLTWRVENSWGEKYGRKGIFSMSHSWFVRHMVTCVVEREFIDPAYLSGLDAEPVELAAWDPLFSGV
ncbi:hypothetical protein H8R18_04110 [Nanchangia anserum]|uniref:Peptidase C1A papain C-terminal domain-containing protein n=1 Tax=Nanchangia anserum TaxID=2692125 RepID=A0A8I0GAM7_9ACTO|nr:hypothetical protein [Nanchangia anserum]QOX82670.1 hypothetical protein H8R18_04110 [Nanchangia anserum]